MARFAADTNVPVAKSRAEIETILMRYGASGFFSGFSDNKAMVGFQIAERMVKVVMRMPDRDDEAFTHYMHGGTCRKALSPDAAEKKWEQACRQRWRSLCLIIKAKLEAVECGLTTVEREFLADIVMPDGRSFGDWAHPQVDKMYENGNMPPLLGVGGGADD
jgi:hypothetical protein